jgi:hypothetical protein
VTINTLIQPLIDRNYRCVIILNHLYYRYIIINTIPKNDRNNKIISQKRSEAGV